MVALLRMLVPSEWFGDGRLIGYSDEGQLPGERLIATDELLLAEWPSATCTAGRPTHCLTPRAALIGARAMIARASGASDRRDRRDRGGSATATVDDADAAKATTTSVKTPPAALIYTARRGVSMRSLDGEQEDELLALLGRLADRYNLELVNFDGGRTDASTSISLFQRAAVIVGVHGGALANVLYCEPPAEPARPRTLLVEIGLSGGLTRHFEHAARCGRPCARIRIAPAHTSHLHTHRTCTHIARAHRAPVP